MDRCLINGLAGETIPVTDRGFSYGDGLFETIAVRDGCLRFLSLHLERLAEGAARLGLPLPDPALVLTELEALARNCARGTAKLILSRGPGPRGYMPPPAPAVTRVVSIQDSPPPDLLRYREGIQLRYCRTAIGDSPALAGLKTLNRLEQVLARSEWQDPQIAEGLMCGIGGDVVCGTMSNLFIVVDGQLLTPRLDRCGILGVMRRVVIGEAVRLGIEVTETMLMPADLNNASEVFVTNSQIGLWPAASIGRRHYPVGPVSQALMAALRERGVSECVY